MKIKNGNRNTQYKNSMEFYKEAYQDILAICNKYSTFFSNTKNLKKKTKNYLLLIEWYELFSKKAQKLRNELKNF